MQSDSKELYKLTSKRTGESEQLYKDIGNFVFSSLYSNMRAPETLLLKLKGVGTWYLRRQRMQIAVDRGMTIMKNDDKEEILNIFSNRLEDYKKYVELKNSIREIRKTLTDGKEPSKDNT